MNRKDMKYRNKVLRKRAGRQYREINKMIKDRVIGALKYQVTKYQPDVGSLSGVVDIAMDGMDSRIAKIRAKHDHTLEYSLGVERELKRLKNAENRP